MLFIADFIIDKKKLSMHKSPSLVRESEKDKWAAGFGVDVFKKYPFKENDLVVEGEERWTNRIIAFPQDKWNNFKNELRSVLDAGHMSEEQKKEAIHHLLVYLEKN